MSIKKYEEFLNILDEDLHKMFENQKEHLHCKEGCSYCCERGDYPFSKLEFEYLMVGFKNLSMDLQVEIKSKIEELKKENPKSFVCPFLIDHKCSVYNYRAIICRTFGLLTRFPDGEASIPFCANLDLNYSKYFDKEKQCITSELAQKRDWVVMPHVFNINLNRIMTLDIVKELGLEFGEVKSLIKWF